MAGSDDSNYVYIDDSEIESWENVKNYEMIRQLVNDAGSNYNEEEGLTELEYYSENLLRVNSLNTFIDDENEGLLAAGLSFFKLPYCPKVEAILGYIVGHQNIGFLQNNVATAIEKSDYIFFKLIEAGIDVHHKYWTSGFTVLHIAVLRKNKNIVKYLLDQKVEVNCSDPFAWTPLHHALESYDNLEIIELLIQYGADLHLRNSYFLTPLEYGVTFKQFNNVSSVLNSELTVNMITFDLLQSVFSCFCELDAENSEAFNAKFVRYFKPDEVIGYYEFFELLYERVVKDFIANHNTTEPPILSIYLNTNVFQSKEWADALTVILTSEIASTLLKECLYYEQQSIYALLIPNLIRAKVEQVEDRCELLNRVISLGMKPNLQDMALILSHYRFAEEFKHLILHLREDSLINNYDRENPMEYLACIFCGLENDLDYNAIFGEELPEEFYNYIKQYFTPALSSCTPSNNEINQPNVLFLREIVRNSARDYIRANNEILTPKDFYSAVESLPTSVNRKNFILLLSNLYNYN